MAGSTEHAEHEWQQPVEVSTQPHLRPDGQLVRITLKQGDVEMQLTVEQARSLCNALVHYAGTE